MKRWTAGLAAATLLTASTPAMVAWAGHPNERRADQLRTPQRSASRARGRGASPDRAWGGGGSRGGC